MLTEVTATATVTTSGDTATITLSTVLVEVRLADAWLMTNGLEDERSLN